MFEIDFSGVSRLVVECSDEWESVYEISLVRKDTGKEVGAVWVCVGVPPHLRGMAEAVGSSRGLMEVWPYGDTPDAWCPSSLLDRAGEVLKFVTPLALESAWNWDEVLDIVKRAEAHGPLTIEQLREAGIIAAKNKRNEALAHRVRAALTAHSAATGARQLPGDQSVIIEYCDRQALEASRELLAYLPPEQKRQVMDAGAVEPEMERARR